MATTQASASQQHSGRNSSHLLPYIDLGSSSGNSSDFENVPLESIQVSGPPAVPENVQSEDIQNAVPPANPHVENHAYKYAIWACITSMLLGFDVGVMSEAMVQINKDKRMTNREVEYLAAGLNVCSIIGSALTGWTSDYKGRRWTIMLTGALFFIGTLLMVLFPNNYLILVGRFVSQLGVGFAPMIASIYIAEISPASSRGFLSSLPQVSMNFGTLFGYIFNYGTSKLHPDVRLNVILSLGVISPFVLAIGVCIMPESPRWLIMKGRLRDAKVVIAKISDSAQEAALLLNKLKEAVNIPIECDDNIVQVNMQPTEEGVWEDLLHSPPGRHMLLCAIGIHVLQQVCGFDTLILYSPRIFEKAGFTSSNGKQLLTIGFHSVKAVVSLIPTCFLDRVGRYRLVVSSIGGIIVSLFSFGVCLIGIDHSDTKSNWAVAIFIWFYFYVAFYSIGMGPIALVYSSELFPLRLRAQGNAIAVACNQVLGAIFSLIPLYEVIPLGGIAFFFTVMAIFALLSVDVVMPETRGQTLEEIWHFFGILFMWRSTRREIEKQRDSARGRQ